MTKVYFDEYRKRLTNQPIINVYLQLFIRLFDQPALESIGQKMSQPISYIVLCISFLLVPIVYKYIHPAQIPIHRQEAHAN